VDRCHYKLHPFSHIYRRRLLSLRIITYLTVLSTFARELTRTHSSIRANLYSGPEDMRAGRGNGADEAKLHTGPGTRDEALRGQSNDRACSKALGKQKSEPSKIDPDASTPRLPQLPPTRSGHAPSLNPSRKPKFRTRSKKTRVELSSATMADSWFSRSQRQPVLVSVQHRGS
jgi:hypothetical protein